MNSSFARISAKSLFFVHKTNKEADSFTEQCLLDPGTNYQKPVMFQFGEPVWVIWVPGLGMMLGRFFLVRSSFGVCLARLL